MSNSTQTLTPNQNKNPAAQRDAYSSQNNTGPKDQNTAGKVGNNVEKDEPTAKGGMKEGMGSSKPTHGDGE